MIKQKSIMVALSLFALAMILITAYTTVAATNTTAANSSKIVNTDNTNVSDNYGSVNNKTDSAWLNDKLTASKVQVQIMGNVDDGNNYQHTWVEINESKGCRTWNYTEYNSKHAGDNGYDALRVLAGPSPMNSSKKVDMTPVLDAVGQEEAQFGDVQHVTIYGIDDASIIDNYGYGDCWADSCWLYNKLSALGVQVRIMGYEDGGNDDGYRHTWIEVNTGNGWQTWNYTKYNSQHAGDNGYGTPYVLIGPGNAPADIMKTGY